MPDIKRNPSKCQEPGEENKYRKQHVTHPLAEMSHGVVGRRVRINVVGVMLEGA